MARLAYRLNTGGVEVKRSIIIALVVLCAAPFLIVLLVVIGTSGQEISAQALADAFIESPTRAEAKYRNRVLVVSGFGGTQAGTRNKEVGFQLDPVGSEAHFRSVVCALSTAPEKSIRCDAKRRPFLRVRGRLQGYDSESSQIRLVECEILSVEY
jgi:hypothetical protein